MNFLLILLNIFFVSFADKPVQATPALSPRAVEQRAKWNIAIDDLDYPVHAAYLDSLRQHGATICHTSRWMNGATCSMTDEQAAAVAQLPFVTGVEATRLDRQGSTVSKRRSMPAEAMLTNHATDELPTDAQLALYNLQPLHELGYHGQGILITVCDGGFTNANTLGCFRQSQELGHFDFTDDITDMYGYTGVHGTMCLSAISGKTEQYTGAATAADYYLMRSEEAETESPKEMDNLVAALEKADSLGTNIFTVSLGYAMFDNDEWTLTYDALDGKTTRASRAAHIAARKGMLVCVAAGNDGDKMWERISVPADADSILTVGAVNVKGEISSFSSHGPSADNRVKPDVCAVGVSAALIDTNGEIVYRHGTSFATPLIAGLAATLWSALPDENAMKIRERIIRSADRYQNPDARQYGYGIPDAYAAYLGRTTGIDRVVDSQKSIVESTKVLRDGQLLIIRGGKMYDTMGRMVDKPTPGPSLKGGED